MSVHVQSEHPPWKKAGLALAEGGSRPGCLARRKSQHSCPLEKAALFISAEKCHLAPCDHCHHNINNALDTMAALALRQIGGLVARAPSSSSAHLLFLQLSLSL